VPSESPADQTGRRSSAKLAELDLEDLGEGARGEGVHRVDRTRHLEVGEAALAGLDDLGLERGLVDAERGHHERHDHLVEELVVLADDRDLGDAGGPGDDVLELARPDILAPDLTAPRPLGRATASIRARGTRHAGAGHLGFTQPTAGCSVSASALPAARTR